MFGKTEKNKEMQNQFTLDWLILQNKILVLQLDPCDLLQLAPSNDFINSLIFLKNTRLIYCKRTISLSLENILSIHVH